MQDMHAIGFSSGAYMTSRMAFTYPGAFRSLSIQSGSYYFCDGACPNGLPDAADDAYLKIHPPTLFLHGTADQIVPPETSLLYEQNLVNNWGRTAERHTQSGATHMWIDSAPTLIPSWIQKFSTTAREHPFKSTPIESPSTVHAAVANETFHISQNGACLRPTSVTKFGVLRLGECDESAKWVRWESGAIAHQADTSLCIRSNMHAQSPDQTCQRGQVMWLEPCFMQPMRNFFKHDETAIGSLLSEGCHGMCLAYSSKEDVTLLGNCTEDGAQNWKMS